jgi:hypothetical protein
MLHITPRAAIMAAAALYVGAGVARAAEELRPYPHQAQFVQKLSVFDNPEAVIFSEDGSYVFVSNAAELGNPDKGFAFIRNGGYISRLAVQPDGSLEMKDEKFVSGLTAPLGMAVNPVATQKFPKGTIFVAQATAPLAEADGTPIKDASAIEPKITAFDVNGEVLGEIKLGPDSAIQKASGVVSTLPNALAFDKQGNLYIAETGIGGNHFDPPITTGGGIYMLPAGSLDALAEGKDETVHYIAVPDGGPDGIEVSSDGIVHFNTVGVVAGMKDPAEGGMYRVRTSDFEAGTLPKPFNEGLGALDGLTFAGTARLDTEIKNTSSVVVTPFWSDRSYVLTYDQDVKLNGPADIAVHKRDDGSYLLVIPELAATSPNNRDNSITVIKLPADFDKFSDTAAW